MTETILLKDIPFQVNIESLMKKLRVKEGSSYIERLEQLVERAEALARPKAMYRVAFIQSKGEDAVVVDGIQLESRVLRINLEDAQRIFPYVATCGTELEAWASSIDDVLQRYWAETINEMALRVAIKRLNADVEERYRPGRTSSMSPGSLGEWPIQAQRPLFQLLGNPKETIGVELSDSLLMIPTKSVSGIRFPTETNFASCQLCPRDRCPSRQAPYEPELYERKYATQQERTAG